MAAAAIHKADIKYSTFRGFALRMAEQNVNMYSILANDPKYRNLYVLGDVRLTLIDQLAISAWNQAWQQATPARPLFPWTAIIRRERTHLQRFEVAVWHKTRVCALCVGKPSRGPDNLTLRFLERVAGPQNPLKGLILFPIFEAANYYARILQKNHVKLKDPLPAAISKYQSFGFTFERKLGRAIYYARRVT